MILRRARGDTKRAGDDMKRLGVACTRVEDGVQRLGMVCIGVLDDGFGSRDVVYRLLVGR